MSLKIDPKTITDVEKLKIDLFAFSILKKSFLLIQQLWETYLPDEFIAENVWTYFAVKDWKDIQYETHRKMIMSMSGGLFIFHNLCHIRYIMEKG